MSREKYHCNFIYNSKDIKSTNDSELATKFVYFLDSKISGWGFKCYISERDCLAGSNVFDTLFAIVSESGKCLVIITPEFRKNYWAKYCKQAAFKYLLQEENQHKMIPITLNIEDLTSLRELNVNDPIHIKGVDEDVWENNHLVQWNKLRKTIEELRDVPHVAEEQGDNLLRTEIQQQLVTAPSSAVNMSNDPFFPSERVLPDTTYNSLEETSFLSVDGVTPSVSLPDSRQDNSPLQPDDILQSEVNETQEGITRTDDVMRPRLKLSLNTMNLDTVDGVRNVNSDSIRMREDNDSRTSTTPDEINNPRPETIGGDANSSIESPNDSDIFVDITHDDDETDLKIPVSDKEIRNPDDQLQQNQSPKFQPNDSGYTTPSEVTKTVSSNGVNGSENQTDGQKYISHSVNPSADSAYQFLSMPVVNPPAMSSLPNETKSKSTVSRVGNFLSLVMERLSSFDVAFK